MNMMSKLGAAVLAMLAVGAQASTILGPVKVETATSFTDVAIGNIVVSGSGLFDVTGSLFALSSVSGSVTVFNVVIPLTFSLQAVSFSDPSSAVGLAADLDPTSSGFSFAHVGAGSYLLKASGSLAGSADLPGLAFIGASYNVVAAPVPEPETYALMLAGLGALGFLARRRRQG